MEKEIYKGTIDFDDVNDEFIDDEGMIKIESMLKEMELCLGDDRQEGSFYYRPKDDSWWHYIQYETYDTTLERVSREHIESKFPYIRCEDRTPVDWLD
tara:strand:- start:859 stop:1152 length:294 start_codon:yes stop_codon:yes gene_type:complete